MGSGTSKRDAPYQGNQGVNATVDFRCVT